MTLAKTKPVRSLSQVPAKHEDYGRKVNLSQKAYARLQRLKWRLVRLSYVEEVHCGHLSPYKGSAGQLYFNVTFADASPAVLARIHRIIQRRIKQCCEAT